MFRDAVYKSVPISARITLPKAYGIEIAEAVDEFQWDFGPGVLGLDPMEDIEIGVSDDVYIHEEWRPLAINQIFFYLQYPDNYKRFVLTLGFKVSNKTH